MTDPTNDWIAPLGQMLDGLGIAMCLFDEQDRTQAWNETFLRFFPEHAGHVHVGEPYCDNLRRFYLGAWGPTRSSASTAISTQALRATGGKPSPLPLSTGGGNW